MVNTTKVLMAASADRTLMVASAARVLTATIAVKARIVAAKVKARMVAEKVKAHMVAEKVKARMVAVPVKVFMDIVMAVNLLVVNMLVMVMDLAKCIKCKHQHHLPHRHLHWHWQVHLQIMEVPWFQVVMLVMAVLTTLPKFYRKTSLFGKLNSMPFWQVRGTCKCSSSSSGRRSS
jgi:hypothetical protein